MFLFAYNQYREQEHSISTYYLSPEELKLIHDGDIILRHGFGFASDVIVESYNNDIDISHCAIITKIDNKFVVVHSVSQSLSEFDGVQTQPLNPFVNDSQVNSVMVVRYKKKPDEVDQSCLGERAKYYLNKRVPFDNEFNLKDTSQIYCAELLSLCLKHCYNFDVFTSPDGKIKYNPFGFQCFLDTARFEVIINHHLRKK